MSDVERPSLTPDEVINVAERAVIGLRAAQRLGVKAGIAMYHSDAHSLMAVIYVLSTTVNVLVDRFNLSDEDISAMFQGARDAERALRE